MSRQRDGLAPLTERELEAACARLRAIEIRYTTFLDLDPPFLSPAAARLAMSRERGD